MNSSSLQRIHCGCIVSFHMFVLLDAGGIECITCARKSFILVSCLHYCYGSSALGTTRLLLVIYY